MVVRLFAWRRFCAQTLVCVRVGLFACERLRSFACVVACVHWHLQASMRVCLHTRDTHTHAHTHSVLIHIGSGAIVANMF